MIKKIISALFMLSLSVGAVAAQSCATYPNTLTNGQPADATQVMANFNFILNCLNNSAAAVKGSGGYVNKIRNGTLAVWTRGTSSLVTSTSSPGSYTADGWQVQQTAAVGSCAQDVGNNGARFSLRCVGATGNADTIIRQPIESYDAASLAAQTVTVQFQYKQDTGSSVTPNLSTCFAAATDNFSTCTSDLASTGLSACASGSWCTEAFTLSASPGAGNGYRIEIDCNTALSPSQHCWITAADVRVTSGVPIGINTSPPTPELRSVQAELAQCQRFLPSWRFDSVGTLNQTVGFGGAFNTTQMFVSYKFPVTARAVPTAITISAATDFTGSDGTTAGKTLGTLVFGNTNRDVGLLVGTVQSGTPYTVGQWSVLSSASSTAFIIWTGAEL
jgi:hypothetical protein